MHGQGAGSDGDGRLVAGAGEWGLQGGYLAGGISADAELGSGRGSDTELGI